MLTLEQTTTPSRLNKLPASNLKREQGFQEPGLKGIGVSLAVAGAAAEGETLGTEPTLPFFDCVTVCSLGLEPHFV